MFDASTATLLLILDTHPSVGFHCSYDRSHPSQHTHTHSLENAIDCGSFIDDLSDVELWQLADFLLDIKSCDDVRSHCRYITLQHIISCHIMSHHVMSHHVMSHHVISCHTVSTSIQCVLGKKMTFSFYLYDQINLSQPHHSIDLFLSCRHSVSYSPTHCPFVSVSVSSMSVCLISERGGTGVVEIHPPYPPATVDRSVTEMRSQCYGRRRKMYI